MNIYGHATPEEKQQIQALECCLDIATSPLENILKLALLYIEPCHRLEDAVSMLQAILKRDPNNNVSKLWIAYCCRWGLISPDWQHYAQELLYEVIVDEPDSQIVGGAYFLLAQLERELSFPSWNEPNVLSHQIDLLKSSILHAPLWVNNHVTLSLIYKDAGRINDAISEMQEGIQNITNRDSNWDLATLYFEAEITGRPARTEFWTRKLYEMQAEAQLQNNVGLDSVKCNNWYLRHLYTNNNGYQTNLD